MLPKEEASPLKNISLCGGEKILTVSSLANMVLVQKYTGMVARLFTFTQNSSSPNTCNLIKKGMRNIWKLLYCKDHLVFKNGTEVLMKSHECQKSSCGLWACVSEDFHLCLHQC